MKRIFILSLALCSLMTGFAWSRDGKQLACTRGVLVRDAVLISDLGK
jgi:hypothetical protein